MRFVYDGRRIDQTTGHTNRRKAEAYAEAYLAKLRDEGVGILSRADIPNSGEQWLIFLSGRHLGKGKVRLAAIRSLP